MEIANLQAFVAIADSGSFSAAAEQLHLTQPAISKRIAQLSNEFDVKLFDRIGRGVHLTAAGQTLYSRARSLLHELEDTRRALAGMTDSVSGRLTMATSHHIALHRLPDYLKQYIELYPQVALDLRFTDSETGCRGVEAGEYEFAVVTLPLRIQTPLLAIPLWVDQLQLVVGSEHPLAHNPPQGIDELLAYPAIMPERGTFTWEVMQQSLESATHKVKVGLSSNYLETIKMLVSVGLGWSILPQSMLEGSQLVVLEFAEIHLQRTLGIVYHQNKTLSNAARRFIEILARQSSISGR